MESSKESNGRLKSLLRKSGKDEIKEIYKRHGIKYNRVVKLVNEIRLDGSNTIANLFRWGDGVNYDEIVMDVADKVGVEYNSDEIKSESELEFLILRHLLKKHFDSLSEEEREKPCRVGNIFSLPTLWLTSYAVAQ